MWGTEAAGLYRIKNWDKCAIDLRFGFRQLQLAEEYGISTAGFRSYGYVGGEELGDPDGGTMLMTTDDQFKVKSTFLGAQMGAQMTMDFDRIRLKFVPRVSLGASILDADVSGSAFGLDLEEGDREAVASGFYTHANNIGNWDETKFAVVPELDVGIEVRISRNVSFNAGGWLKYWSSVARASEQVDRRLDRRGMATSPFYDPDEPMLSPSFKFDTSDLLGYGFFAGIKGKF
jgi:hypothetical protein